MKIPYYCLFIGSLSLIGCDSALPARESTPPSLVVLYNKNIKLDGKLNDWGKTKFINVDKRNGVFESEEGELPASFDSDISYKFALCYDEEALYIAVIVVDDVVVTDNTTRGQVNAECWKDDAVEIFIDGNFNRTCDSRDMKELKSKSGGEFAMTINRAATSTFSSWPDTFGQNQYWDGATNWCEVQNGKPAPLIYEFRLSYKMFGYTRVPYDTPIGFTIGVQDDDNGDKRDHALYWAAKSPNCWKNESGWGIIILSPEKNIKTLPQK